MKWLRPGDASWRRRGRRRGFRLPPPPPGLSPRLRRAYLLVAAILSMVAGLSVPMCRGPEIPDGAPWRVDTVHDGDTVTCRDPEGKAWKIRLLGIDAPEFGQPYGEASRRALAAKLADGTVRVAGKARDQHGRLLGTLWIGDRDLNRELVAEGMAWAFGGFSPDEALLAAEAEARRARRGLWSDPEPMSPGQWRRLHPPHR